MWATFDLTGTAAAWATRETLWVIIWGTLGLMMLFGAAMRAERSGHLEERDDWDKMV